MTTSFEAGGNFVALFERFEGQWWYVDEFAPPQLADPGNFGHSMVAHDGVISIAQSEEATIYHYEMVSFAAPVLLFETRPADPLHEGGLAQELATDGEVLVIDGYFITQWDPDCNGDGVFDDCRIAAGTLSDSNGNGIADECEAPDCVADFAAPAGVLDFFDVSMFLNLYSAGDPRADLAPPYCTMDFFDLAAYLSAFSAGCP